MSVLDVIDEVATGLVPSGSTADGTGARPPVYLPDTLYAWPATSEYAQTGTGEMDELRIRFRVAWGVDASAEIASMTRDRASSEDLDGFVDDVATWVRAHRTGTAYENLAVAAVDWDLITHDIRGVIVDLTGWTIES
jgi:hypothetical protein